MTEEEFINILKTGSFKERFDAVSRANPAYLTRAVSDKDENIRYKAASRIPAQYLSLLRNDASERVRNIVSERLKL
ncbi:MAG: hypothetical protein M0Z72_04585 [Deltaproteobacteria bacterium]|nr:hypothetical protein [Deltaproteobacteria bacterium]